VLTQVARHGATLARLGCRTLGDVRRLPRAGLSRRFGKELLEALDRAYGLRPEPFEWLVLPEIFEARLELPGKVEHAAGLVFGGQRLLAQMAGWLAARHAGVRAFTLTWRYEFHRAKDSPDEEQLQIHTAEPTRATDHFTRLLTEHLNKTRLAAAVEELRLRADEVEPLQETSASLLQEKARQAESLVQLVERLAGPAGAGAGVAAGTACRPPARVAASLVACHRHGTEAGRQRPRHSAPDVVAQGPDAARNAW
jgi:protein ImuB